MHYANGREAKVGDLVVGTAYNTHSNSEAIAAWERTREGERPPQINRRLAGVLVKAVPGSDTCNAEIEWIESTEVFGTLESLFAARPRMAVGEAALSQTGAGLRLSWRCRDYTHVGALLHVEDAIAAAWPNPAAIP